MVLIPSLGRGASDFDLLLGQLGEAGYQAIAPQPRGIGGSKGDLSGLTMADSASDIAAVIHGLCLEPVTIVGHAFGNRVSRMVATDFPHLIDSVVLLCCGGLIPPAPEHASALRRVFDIELSDDEHLQAVSQAFFSPGNDASVWFDGWHGIVAAVQAAATVAQPVEYWWGAGGKEIFVIQPEDDVMAVPENAVRLCAELGNQASIVTIANAGHALLPEQPAAVADAVLSWLDKRNTTKEIG